MIRLARKFPLLHISLLSLSSEVNPVTAIQVQAVYVGGAESTGRNEEVSQGKEGSSEGCVVEPASTVGNWSLVVPGTWRNSVAHTSKLSTLEEKLLGICTRCPIRTWLRISRDINSPFLPSSLPLCVWREHGSGKALGQSGADTGSWQQTRAG